MVTSTIYSDAETVIVDIGTVPATAPWLKQTTYLLDPAGHTTAVLAQTNRPTSGVTLAPVPYTAPTPTSTSLLSTASSASRSGRVVTTSQPSPTPTESVTAPSPTAVKSRTPRVAVPVTAAVVGVLVAIAIAVAVLYLRGRTRRKRLQKKSRRQTSPTSARAWPPADRTPSWEDFVKETFEYCANFDESFMSSSEDNGSRLGLRSSRSGHRPSTPEMRRQYELLQLNDQQSSHLRRYSSDTYVESPARQVPSTRAPARAHLGQPTSILKRPASRRVANMGEGAFEDGDEQGPRGVPANSNMARAKKCVRFGVNQIREFGMSPFIGHGSDW